MELQDIHAHGTDPEQPSSNAVFKEYQLENPHSYRALFLKNASLQKRQKCTNCCQLCVPIVIIVIIGAMNIIINNLLAKNAVDTVDIQFGQVAPLNYIQTFPYVLYVNSTGSDLGSLNENGDNNGFLGLMSQLSLVPSKNVSQKGPGPFVPFYVPEATADSLDQHVIDLKVALIKILHQQAQTRTTVRNGKIDISSFNTSSTSPLAAVLFNSLDFENLDGDMKVMWESQTDFIQQPGRAAVSETMNNLASAIAQFAIHASLKLEGFIQALPFKNIKRKFDISSIVAEILFPFAFSFLLPVFVHGIVVEKQERLREMMKMNGLSMTSYWLINYMYNMVLYILICLGIIIIGLIFQLPFFLNTSGGITFLVFFSWGVNQISEAMLLSTFFSKARTATIICYLLVLVSILSSIVVNNAVWPDVPANPAYFIYPPFAFYRAIFVIGSRCSAELCPQISDMTPNSELATAVIVLFIEAVGFMILTPYLDQILPQEFGVRKSPLFIFHELFGKEEEYTKIENHDHIEDSDVNDERKMVTSLDPAEYSKYPILIANLHKRYGDKIAVQDLCLTIQNGECFGLLGPNGAGKTTTISMLTGLFMPTEGSAYVGGYDIRTEMDKIHQIIGICPQFDLLWEDLTCKETLLFYSRLKGARKQDEQEMANNVLAQVGLDKFDDMLVKNLSGGMKRRLSVAVSLVGNPKIIFLDEPSTGLDPDNRRQLWNVLLHVKQNKCLILTSHSMEEADILCTRIGIMSKGNLKCLGSNVRLKNKFGEGYSLNLNFEPENEQTVTEFVKQILPNAKMQESFAGNCTYHIPSAGFLMSELLEQMISHKEKVKIQDWGVTQTTLEDVFLNIVRSDEEHSGH